jgi:aldehyde:ferredoxin oxidoreductase
MNKKWFGWSGRILCVDLTSRTVEIKALSEGIAHRYLGQAGINARLLYDNTSAATDPFSPAAPLIFGAGPLAGTLAPCSGRFSVTFKSPLTGSGIFPCKALNRSVSAYGTWKDCSM